MADTHKVRPEYGNYDFDCPERGTSMSFEQGEGWQFCPYCGAKLVFP